MHFLFVDLVILMAVCDNCTLPVRIAVLLVMSSHGTIQEVPNRSRLCASRTCVQALPLCKILFFYNHYARFGIGGVVKMIKWDKGGHRAPPRSAQG